MGYNIEMAYWLLKSEPGVYSIDDLEREGKTLWEGVRNYQARNLLRDELAVGDEVLFYHSNATPPGVAGIAKVIRAGYPDPFAFQEGHKYFDPKSDPKAPRWYVVDVGFVRRFPRIIGLPELRETPGLEDMMLLRKGSRLSVQPVTPQEWNIILSLAG